ncbi:putative Amino-acid transporter arg-13 [Glarea lozoyensis 74030]|uniref:Putative Amino-acid transporter arg-13 n=1 Tax=Glarea lozoyensis (strain ATCC 74030 / MF5533) TaxID=1104152 RepID=H0ERI3_GLAL7|nr:putative Amino-acid transporter arg-13 [Glarea lozoyensis 74030]
MSLATETTPLSSPSPIGEMKGKEAVMEALEDITFGSIAGIAGKYIEYPFDTVKTTYHYDIEDQLIASSRAFEAMG